MQDRLHVQYRTDTNLNARIQLHARFSTNPTPWQKWVFDQFQLPAQAAILELGCGPGNLWMLNKERLLDGWIITLTDFSKGMLAAAQQNLQDVFHHFNFRLVDAQDIPFSDGSFDAVIANHMLYHVIDRSRALSEIKRVLKKGAQLYASTVGERHMNEIWALLQPYTPQKLERSPLSFTLENGTNQLAPIFDEVKRVDYDDSLEITDPEAVIAYLRSSTTLADFTLTDVAVAHVYADVNQAIAERGAFHVTKATGLFIAT